MSFCSLVSINDEEMLSSESKMNYYSFGKMLHVLKYFSSFLSISVYQDNVVGKMLKTSLILETWDETCPAIITAIRFKN